jgi:hypothetical protein
MSRLHARNAREMMLAKQDSFDRTLKVVRNMVDSSIKDAARMGKKSVTVNVPSSVFGHEPYNPVDMGKALSNELFGDDYQVTGTYAKMTISWSSQEKVDRKPSVQSPVVKVPRLKPPN